MTDITTDTITTDTITTDALDTTTTDALDTTTTDALAQALAELADAREALADASASRAIEALPLESHERLSGKGITALTRTEHAIAAGASPAIMASLGDKAATARLVRAVAAATVERTAREIVALPRGESPRDLIGGHIRAALHMAGPAMSGQTWLQTFGALAHVASAIRTAATAARKDGTARHGDRARARMEAAAQSLDDLRAQVDDLRAQVRAGTLSLEDLRQ